MVYFPVAQLPRSSRRHRSLQNGKSASVSESVGFLQIGQCRFIQRAYRKELADAARHGGRGLANHLSAHTPMAANEARYVISPDLAEN